MVDWCSNMWKIKLFPIDWKHTKMVVWCPNMWHNLQYGISKLVWFFPHHLGRASVIKRGLLVFPLETHWPFYYGFYLTMSLANLFIVSMHQALNFGFLKCFLCSRFTIWFWNAFYSGYLWVMERLRANAWVCGEW